MTEITASLVQSLRIKTGVGMMDCKKALTEANGDLELACDLLRKKGLSKAHNKNDRVTYEGVIAFAINDHNVALVELQSETDFVAKNEKFVNLATEIADIAVKTLATTELLTASILPNGKVISDAINENIMVLGENIRLGKVGYLSVKKGIVQSYIHNAISNRCGKIGVAIAIESDTDIIDKTALNELAKQISMHIAATNPESLNIESLDPIRIEKEKTICAEQAKASGKPEAVIEKMIEGRMRKFYDEVVLEEQPCIMVPDKKIKDLVKELGGQLKIVGYLRFSVNN